MPDGVHVVEAVPHAWLFPQTVGVVHHGGAGTTAAGLLAARPTWSVPCWVIRVSGRSECTIWARGPAPPSVRRLSVDELADD